MDWQKCILQKDKIYYFKYREFSDIFTINNHIFDKSIQTNIKLTFTIYIYRGLERLNGIQWLRV